MRNQEWQKIVEQCSQSAGKNDLPIWNPRSRENSLQRGRQNKEF